MKKRERYLELRQTLRQLERAFISGSKAPTGGVGLGGGCIAERAFVSDPKAPNDGGGGGGISARLAAGLGVS